MTKKSKKKVEPQPFTVLRDTGEKKGWFFTPSEDCLGTIEQNLYTADYSLDGYYDNKFFVVERKGCVSEFVANISQKEKWDDFKAELQRLESFKFPFVICEFPFSLLETYPIGSNIPRKLWDKIRIGPEFLVCRFWEIQLRFKTKFLFADMGGKDVFLSLCRRIVERHPRQ